MPDIFKLAICQMKVVSDKKANISKAVEMLMSAAAEKIDIAVLPEMFNCPYDSKRFGEYAETQTGETVKAISNAASEHGIYVIAGSIPELSEGNIYNTSFIFDRSGNIIGKHRKMHLFDIDVHNRITFRESDTLSAGNAITVAYTEFCPIGIAICYDMRFPELMRLMSLKGAKLIIVPAAFNMITGPAHWEPLIRVRAVDNQVFMAAASPSSDESADYVAYGHSMIVGPWGNVLKKAGKGEEILFEDINLSEVERIRKELPLLKHRRTDIYELREMNADNSK